MRDASSAAAYVIGMAILLGILWALDQATQNVLGHRIADAALVIWCGIYVAAAFAGLRTTAYGRRDAHVTNRTRR